VATTEILWEWERKITTGSLTEAVALGRERGARVAEGPSRPTPSRSPRRRKDGDLRRRLRAGRTAGVTTSAVKIQHPFAGKFSDFRTWFCCAWKGEMLVRGMGVLKQFISF